MKKYSITLIIMTLLLGYVPWVYGIETPVISVSSQAEQAYLVDETNGVVLYQKNANQPISPGSLSKLMVVYVVFELIKSGKIGENSMISVEPADLQKSRKRGAPSMFLEAGDTVSIKELVQGIIVNLGNDATIVLAKGVLGSEENFVREMNVKANEIGMKNTHFASVLGDAPDYEQYTTAHDLSVLARQILKEHKKYMPYFSQPTFMYNNIRQYNRNTLLRSRLNVDGFMAGYATESKYSIIATSFSDNMRIIAVLSGLKTLDAQKKETAKLLTWGLFHFHTIPIYEKNTAIGKVPIWNGSLGSITLRTPMPIVITVPKEIHKAQIKVFLDYTTPIVVPIEKGTTIATIKVSTSNSRYKVDIPIITNTAIDRANIFKRALYAWVNAARWLWYKIKG